MSAKAYTLLEMLTTVAALVIVLGLMVALARAVRHQSAEALTRELLEKLEEATQQYTELQPAFFAVPKLIDKDGPPGETELQSAAAANSRAFVKAFAGRPAVAALERLPLSLYDGAMVRDAWGQPVVFMPPGARNIGIAPRSRWFFMSGGPDGRFSTVSDNLYSSEHRR